MSIEIAKSNTEAAETLRLVQAMGPQIRRHVVPLIEFDERNQPSVQGTALVVRHRGRIILATASHVLTPLREGRRLYTFMSRDLREVDGEMIGSDGSTDLAVLIPSEGEVVFAVETGVEPIDSSRLVGLVPPHSDRLFLACGYPSTRARVRRARGEFVTPLYSHLAMGVSAEKVRALGLTERHLVVEMNKAHVIGLSGRRQRAPDPHGMSGSPLFLMADRKTPPESTAMPLIVAGFAIQHRQKDLVLVATNSAFALILMDQLIDGADTRV